jgi:hypothetical protein
MPKTKQKNPVVIVDTDIVFWVGDAFQANDDVQTWWDMEFIEVGLKVKWRYILLALINLAGVLVWLRRSQVFGPAIKTHVRSFEKVQSADAQ